MLSLKINLINKNYPKKNPVLKKAFLLQSRQGVFIVILIV